MRTIFYIILLIITMSVSSHEISLEDKEVEEIINIRMKKMSNINILSQKIYKELNSENFESLKENTLELKHSADDFQMLFPPNSQGKNAKNLIWDDKILFNEYNKNFLFDIDSMLISIDDKNIKDLKENFNNMASNCSACHKKFKNKK